MVKNTQAFTISQIFISFITFHCELFLLNDEKLAFEILYICCVITIRNTTYLRFGKLLCFAIVLMLVGTSTAWSQSKSTLQSRKKKLLNDISYTNKLIEQNKKKQSASLVLLENINKNIESKTSLIRLYEEEVRALEREIDQNKEEIEHLRQKIERLKQYYAQMVQLAWKNRQNLHQMMLIFAADNFHQAYRRSKYFQQMSEFRRGQIKTINDTKIMLENKQINLEEVRKEKAQVLNEQTQAAIALQNEKNQQQQVISELKGKEKEMMAKVEKAKKEANNLSRKIDEIVKKEIEAARKKAAAAAAKKTNTTTNTKTPSANNTTKTPSTASTTKIGNSAGGPLGSSFQNSKGNLPWPVESGVITGKFGVQAHPVLKNITIKNDGIDISTSAGANVRSVFKGEVSGAFKVDGYENVLIIRHDNYLTVYSHLSTVSVSKGTTVQAKQVIGKAATNDEGKTYINFQVRLGNEILNPSLWLSK